MKKDFLSFKADILDEKPSNFELAGINDGDMMFLKAIAISEGLNDNGARFNRVELHKSKDTLEGKPLRILFQNNNPTGHGLNFKTGKFSNLVTNIGYIYAVESCVDINDNTGMCEKNTWSLEDLEQGENYRIVVYVAVWKNYYPEICNRLKELHSQGDLNFSIEAMREFQLLDDGTRQCFNILFRGLAVVDLPADSTAQSLMVAEIINKQKEDTNMEFKEMYEKEVMKTTELSSKIAILEQEKALFSKEKESLESKIVEISEKVVTTEGELKMAKADVEKYKTTVETAEKIKVGTERMEKLKKYGEVKKTIDEIASMTKEEFVDELASVVENFKPNSAIGVDYDKGGLGKSNDKDQLLSFIKGYNK